MYVYYISLGTGRLAAAERQQDEKTGKGSICILIADCHSDMEFYV